jgi:hypothetical protein
MFEIETLYVKTLREYCLILNEEQNIKRLYWITLIFFHFVFFLKVVQYVFVCKFLELEGQDVALIYRARYLNIIPEDVTKHTLSFCTTKPTYYSYKQSSVFIGNVNIKCIRACVFVFMFVWMWESQIEFECMFLKFNSRFSFLSIFVIGIY